MNTINAQLKILTSMKLEGHELEELFIQGVIDEKLRSLYSQENLVSKLMRIFPIPEDERNGILKLAHKNIIDIQNKLLSFFIENGNRLNKVNDFDIHKEDPDFIILLGASFQMTRKRTIQALSIMRKFSNARIILSGAGSGIQSEAELMRDIIVKEGICESRTLLEEDSMDTIGNALFTKLMLAELGLLKERVRILVITSNFHTHRSFWYFKKIYGQRAMIGVHGVTTINDHTCLLNMTKHELKSEYDAQFCVLNSVSSVFAPCGTNFYNYDDNTLLFRLVDQHALYKGRQDILRKYKFDIGPVVNRELAL